MKVTTTWMQWCFSWKFENMNTAGVRMRTELRVRVRFGTDTKEPRMLPTARVLIEAQGNTRNTQR